MFYDNGIIWFLYHVKYIHTYIITTTVFISPAHFLLPQIFFTQISVICILTHWQDTLFRIQIAQVAVVEAGVWAERVVSHTPYSPWYGDGLSCAMDNYKLRPSAGVFCDSFVSLPWFFCSIDTSFPEVSGVNGLLMMWSCSCFICTAINHVIQVVPNMHCWLSLQYSSLTISPLTVFSFCVVHLQYIMHCFPDNKRIRHDSERICFNDHIMHKMATLLINNLDENAYISLFRSLLVMCWNMVTWWYSYVILMWFSDEIMM